MAAADPNPVAAEIDRLAETLKAAGLPAQKLQPSNRCPVVTVGWAGVVDGRIALQVQCVGPASDYTAHADLWVRAWDAVAGDPRFSGVPSSVTAFYRQAADGAEARDGKPVVRNYAQFTVVGGIVDARGV